MRSIPPSPTSRAAAPLRVLFWVATLGALSVLPSLSTYSWSLVLRTPQPSGSIALAQPRPEGGANTAESASAQAASRAAANAPSAASAQASANAAARTAASASAQAAANAAAISAANAAAAAESAARLRRLEDLMLRNLARQSALGAQLRAQGNSLDGRVEGEVSSLRAELAAQRALNEELRERVASLDVQARANRQLLEDRDAGLAALGSRMESLQSAWRSILPLAAILLSLALLLRALLRFEGRQMAVLEDIRRASVEARRTGGPTTDLYEEEMQTIWNWLVQERKRLDEVLASWLSDEEGRRLAAAVLATAPASVRSTWEGRVLPDGPVPFFKAEAMAAVVALRDAVARRWRADNDVNERVRDVVRRAAESLPASARAGASVGVQEDASGPLPKAAPASVYQVADAPPGEPSAWLEAFAMRTPAEIIALASALGREGLVSLAAALPPEQVERLLSFLEAPLRAEVASDYAALVQSPSRMRRAARKARETLSGQPPAPRA